MNNSFLYLTALLLGLYVCHIGKLFTRPVEQHQQKQREFKVYKIDSLSNLYLIYAKDANALYKILSHKVVTQDGELIKVNKAYKFELKSIFKLKSDLVTGTMYYGTAIAVERDSINELFISENLVGLHMVR